MTKRRSQQKDHENRKYREQTSLWSWFDRELPPLQPFVLALVVNTLLVCLTYLIFTPQFNTRDDTAMMLLAAGKIIALEPTEYLVFTNIVIGYVLKGLYSFIPAVPWYAVYMIVTLTLTHTALLYGFLSRKPSRGMLLLFFLYYLLFGVHSLLSLQFTIVSSLAAVAGLLLLTIAEPSGNAGFRRFTSLPLLTGSALLLWAWMIRVESTLLMVAVLLPVILVAVWAAGRFKEWLQRRAPVFALTLLLCLIVYGYNDYRYLRWGNVDYREFNNLCREFLDVNILKRTVLTSEELASFLKAGGWSWQDYELMQNWFFMDTTLYAPERLRSAVHEARRIVNSPHTNAERQKEKESYQSDLRTKVLMRIWQVWTSTTALVAYCFVAFAFITFVRPSRSAMIQAAFYLFLGLGATYYIAHQTILRDSPERVTFPLFVALALLPVLFMYSPVSGAPRRSYMQQILSAACIVALVILAANELRNELAVSRENRNNSVELNKIVNTLSPSANNLYVIWADGFPLGWISPFDALQNFQSFHALWLAWCQRTPTSFAMLHAHGVRDIYYDLAMNPKVSFLLSYNQNVREELRYPTRYGTFMREHYGLNVGDKGGTRFLNSVPDSDLGYAYKTFMVGKLEPDKSSTATTIIHP